MTEINLQSVQEAHKRIQKYIHCTPIFSSELLNKWLNHKIFFKAECMQKVGAFKARGACNTIAYLVENNLTPKHIVANSSGNHAQAVAWAASQFSIPATIYMPKTASTVKIQATKAYGAEVVLCDNRLIVDTLTEEHSQKEGVYWLHPYNHPQVIAGQGTAALEALDELKNIDAVFAPCGGGGILSGTVIASKGTNPKIKVIGTEPLKANDAANSLRKGSIQTLPKTPDSLADGALTLSVGNITFEYLKKLDAFYEVEEEKMIYWTQWLTHLLKLRVEPTSAMVMDGVIQWLNEQNSPQKVLVILTGGNIDQETTNKIWQKNVLDQPPMNWL
ncbi:MAG: serine/threonine dehydratase [Bacteroidales bacterium]|nr:serine/threonine dehydratase [Bacteroidales bacterium]